MPDTQENDDTESNSIKRAYRLKKKLSISSEETWKLAVKNYKFIEGAQISNSFIVLMVLDSSEKPLTTTSISQSIARQSKGQIFKHSATLKDSVEYRLKRDGYVESIDGNGKSLYSITPEGKELLKGWISFLSALAEE